jgi:hypothetical protein
MTRDPRLEELINQIGNSAVVIDSLPPALDQALPTCRQCDKTIEGEVKLGKHKLDWMPPGQFHPTCWATYLEGRAKAQEAQRQRELDRRVEDVQKRFAYQMDGHVSGTDGYAICHPPNWPYARFDNAEFRSRSSKKIVGAVEKWDPKKLPTLLLCAPTGKGKTAAIVAWLWRYRDQQIERVRAGEEKVWITSFVFATGPEFTVARRNAALGEEAPLIKHSLDCGILIIDELGFEKPSEVPFEIVDHRYRKQGITVVTTGLRPKEFRAKYGDAMYRRLSESGAVLEDFPSE